MFSRTRTDIPSTAAGSGDKELRLAALEALGKLDERPRETWSLLLSVLQGGGWIERVFTLRSVRRHRFANAAMANLGHGNWRVRIAAIEALGRMRTKDAIPALIGVLAHDLADVQAHADTHGRHVVVGGIERGVTGVECLLGGDGEAQAVS